MPVRATQPRISRALERDDSSEGARAPSGYMPIPTNRAEAVGQSQAGIRRAPEGGTVGIAGSAAGVQGSDKAGGAGGPEFISPAEKVKAAVDFFVGHGGAVGTLEAAGARPMYVKSGVEGGPFGGTQRGGIPRGPGEAFTS